MESLSPHFGMQMLKKYKYSTERSSLSSTKNLEETKMSYFDEEFLSPFLIFEFESLKKECNFGFSPQTIQVDDYPLLNSLQEIMEDCSEAETEVYGKILFYMNEMDEAMEKNNNKLKEWIGFRLEKDKYEAHLCKTSWPVSFGRSSSDYEYVDVMMMDGNDDEKKQVRLIVDLDFRTQFELACPTQAYQELVNSLPVVFVGAEEKLKKLISLVSSAAKQSLREKEMYIPPWRKASYMHSKWLSTDCKKISFSELSQTRLYEYDHFLHGQPQKVGS